MDDRTGDDDTTSADDVAGGGPARRVTVLLATDDDDTFEEVDAALGDESTVVHRLRAGREVRGAVARIDPDLVVLDLQIGNMGGAATALDLRLEAGAGRLPEQRILLLLDRADDQFVARRSGADDWILKPLDALRLRRAATDLLAADPAAPAQPVES